MGVIVEISEPYRCCNSCNSNDGVIEITALMRVGKTKQGTQGRDVPGCVQEVGKQADQIMTYERGDL